MRISQKPPWLMRALKAHTPLCNKLMTSCMLQWSKELCPGCQLVSFDFTHLFEECHWNYYLLKWVIVTPLSKHRDQSMCVCVWWLVYFTNNSLVSPKCRLIARCNAGAGVLFDTVPLSVLIILYIYFIKYFSKWLICSNVDYMFKIVSLWVRKQKNKALPINKSIK